MWSSSSSAPSAVALHVQDVENAVVRQIYRIIESWGCRYMSILWDSPLAATRLPLERPWIWTPELVIAEEWPGVSLFADLHILDSQRWKPQMNPGQTLGRTLYCWSRPTDPSNSHFTKGPAVMAAHVLAGFVRGSTPGHSVVVDNRSDSTQGLGRNWSP